MNGNKRVEWLPNNFKFCKYNANKLTLFKGWLVKLSKVLPLKSFALLQNKIKLLFGLFFI